MKYFRLSYDQILWEISYVNLQLLIGSIPGTKKKEQPNNPDEVTGKNEIDDLTELFGG